MGAEIELNHEQEAHDGQRVAHGPAGHLQADQDENGSPEGIPEVGVGDPVRGVVGILIHPVSDGGCGEENQKEVENDQRLVVRGPFGGGIEQETEQETEQKIKPPVAFAGEDSEACRVEVKKGKKSGNRFGDHGQGFVQFSHLRASVGKE